MTVTKQITHTYGTAYVTVDDCDAYILDEGTWSAQISRQTYYAARNVRVDGRQKTILLHRVIMQAKDGEKIDHIDGNGLNCTRSNMRIATVAQNNQNRRQKRSGTGYIGVTKHGKGYRARVSTDRIDINLGTYSTPEEAARVRDKAAIHHYGSFAVLNFPTQTET